MQETVTTRGLLFDMDGVLISSIGSVRRSWRAWCRHYGVPGAETFEIPHGTRAIEIVRQVKPDIDAEEGLRLIEDIEMADTDDLKVLDGVPELLDSLPKDRWTVVTSATRRLMLERLRVAGLPAPERIIAADDVTNGKPDPEPYRKGAEILGFDPADCIVVEDAPAGVSAGLAAGCRVLGVLGTHQAHELAHATWQVRSLRDVQARPTADGLRLSLEKLP
ncbi:HAD-IA family hydrolase [Terriglobus sp.]|uniref:HAD-IA family hydrolase n=1 Tax=Terriglobus sp. TaxID=1889013 RepID=UPI003B006A25